MTDPPWDEAHHLLGPDRMGALPDLRIPGTSVADWQPSPDDQNRRRGQGVRAGAESSPEPG
ncbi:hypothetical protein [Streptomyces cacaoi]|uniref:hypothetical protein n=1 Tax=Streptomyces cacaoi TaxID=1898 RepID=UPI002614720C|nr:hypothetical protein [Streptomyces cacaoi]